MLIVNGPKAREVVQEYLNALDQVPFDETTSVLRHHRYWTVIVNGAPEFWEAQEDGTINCINTKTATAALLIPVRVLTARC